MVSQSERISVYRAALGRLRAAGVIYPCKRSRRDVAEAVGAPHEGFEPAGAAACNRRTGRSLAQSKIENLEFQMARFARPADSIRRSGADASDGDAMPDAHDEPIFPREWRPAAGAVLPELPAAGVAIASNWRFRVPDGEEVCFVDNALGAQRAVAGRDFGDFWVWRRDDLPSYQLACAVDDAEMGITEVVRGADLVKSAFRQILILRALGAAAPEYYHCALMHDAGGQRLAKRCDALALRTLRAQGVAPGEILRGFAATSSFSGLF
jgi:glutamyl-tRNA synthetase